MGSRSPTGHAYDLQTLPHSFAFSAAVPWIYLAEVRSDLDVGQSLVEDKAMQPQRLTGRVGSYRSSTNDCFLLLFPRSQSVRA